MTTAITLAGMAHLPQVGALVARRRAEATGGEADAVTGEALAEPLLQGGPEGAIWLIGPDRAPLGYVAVTFGWDWTGAVRTATVEDVYVRDTVRRRGIGREVLHAVAVSLRRGGIGGIYAKIAAQDVVGKEFCVGSGFGVTDGAVTLSETR